MTGPAEGDTRRAFGAEGEARAAAYLEREGYRIVDRNVRAGGVEMDLVATRGRQVVFVEVKARRSLRFGTPEEAVHPGNKEFAQGDKIKKPPKGAGKGQGKKASTDGDSEDSFQFTLTQDEFLDIFFEDLELPNLVKRSLKEIKAMTYKRAGITVAGSPTNMNLIRTMRNAHGRRLALRRPSTREMNELKERLFALERIADPGAERHGGARLAFTQIEWMQVAIAHVQQCADVGIRADHLPRLVLRQHTDLIREPCSLKASVIGLEVLQVPGL